MVKVGLRANNFPQEEEKVVLIEHIMNEYGKHTPLEIKLAFDMAIAGKLDLLDKEVVCYENFSCLYFSKIMNAYRSWAKETYSVLKKDKPMEQETELEPIDMIEWIEDWRKQKDINLNLIPLLFYDFLTDTDQIKVSREDKFEYAGKAATSIKTDLHLAIGECKTTDALREFLEFEKMEQEGFSGKFKTMIQNRAKRMIVYDYLKK